MRRVYIITGAAGHLAGTIIQQLKKEDCLVRGLVLPSEQAEDEANVLYYKGDITKIGSMDVLFSGLERDEVIVIHAAGLVSIANEVSPLLYDVNVNGTKHVIAMCRMHHVKRLVYVSSVHAIPEAKNRGVMTEVSSFSKDLVVGAYARTKAEASQAVMDAAGEGLDTVIVHPSGILGPYDRGNNHIIQLIKSYLSGKLPAGVTGGYDFVDVRDVAKGCIAAANKGVMGECYILSNRYYPIRDLLEYMRMATNGRHLPCIPVKLVEFISPVFEWLGRIKKKRPLFTRYSMHTMSSNGRFSHDKATMVLGYSPRDMKQTISDTIAWLKAAHVV